MIDYRDGHDVDLDALDALREACGFKRNPREVLDGQVRGAQLAVAAYDGPRLVGFARALSDGVSNGYISSVMVCADCRRKGVGRALIARLVQGRTDIRWVLHVRRDAAPFYRALGFEDAPDMMWRDRR